MEFRALFGEKCVLFPCIVDEATAFAQRAFYSLPAHFSFAYKFPDTFSPVARSRSKRVRSSNRSRLRKSVANAIEQTLGVSELIAIALKLVVRKYAHPRGPPKSRVHVYRNPLNSSMGLSRAFPTNATNEIESRGAEENRV